MLKHAINSIKRSLPRISFSKIGPTLILTSSPRLREFWRNYTYDIERYLSYSTTMGEPDTCENLKARITAQYHVLEKGLSFPDTRIGFGQVVANRLISYLRKYIELEGSTDDNQFQAALCTLSEYLAFHDKSSFDLAEIRAAIYELKKFSKPVDYSATITIAADDILRDAQGNFSTMARSRYSIRNFKPGSVDNSAIIDAIKIAQKTPSVCNRQSSFLYIVEDPVLKEQVLKCHNGNKGFGHLADKVLIVTSNTRFFYGIWERNQAFIDGGMFGMSLIYALHSLGIGTCTLNWSTDKERDQQLRRTLVEISEEEVIVFLIAVGLIPDELLVAGSRRKDVGEVYDIL